MDNPVLGPKIADKQQWGKAHPQEDIALSPPPLSLARVGMFPKHHARWQLGAIRQKKYKS